MSLSFSHLSALVFLGLVFCLAGCGTPEEKKAAHLDRGMKYAEKGDYKAALIEFKNVVQIDPKDPEGHYQMALAYLKLGSTREAFSELQKTVDVNPGNTDARLKLAQLLLLGKHYAEVMGHVDNILSADPANVDALLLKAAALAEQDKTGEALAILKKAEGDAPGNDKVLMTLAGVHAKRNEIELAEDYLKRAVEASGKGADRTRAMVALSSLYEATGDKAQGEDVLKRLLDESGDDVQSHILLAGFYLRNGRTADAETVLGQAASRFTDNPKPLVALSEILVAKGAREEGLATLEKANGLTPGDADILGRLASVKADLGKIEDAKTLAEESLAKDSNNPQALLAKAKISMKNNEFSLATEDLNKVLSRHPANAEALYLRALANSGAGQLPKAEEDLRTLVTAQPGALKARLLLADVAIRMQKPDIAMEQTDFVLKHLPDDPAVLTLHALALMGKGLRENALKDLEKVVSSAPDNLQARFLIGRNLLALKRLPQAEEVFRDVLARDPAHIPSAVSIVSILYRDKGPDDALAFIAEMEAKNPENAAFLIMEGRLLLGNKRYEEAEKALQKAIGIDPANPTPYSLLAAMYAGMGKLEEALSQYKKLAEKNPKDVSAIMSIGMIEERLGRDNLAEEAYRKALSMEATFAPAANNLAWLLADKRGDLEQAFIYAQKARESAPEQPSILDTFGWILVKRGSHELAASSFEEALKRWPDQPSIHYHMAVAMQGLGRQDAAREHLRKALNAPGEFPEREEAQKLLDALS